MDSGLILAGIWVNNSHVTRCYTRHLRYSPQCKLQRVIVGRLHGENLKTAAERFQTIYQSRAVLYERKDFECNSGCYTFVTSAVKLLQRQPMYITGRQRIRPGPKGKP
jgi:hypothetical protein